MKYRLISFVRIIVLLSFTYDIYRTLNGTYNIEWNFALPEDIAAAIIAPFLTFAICFPYYRFHISKIVIELRNILDNKKPRYRVFSIVLSFIVMISYILIWLTANDGNFRIGYIYSGLYVLFLLILILIDFNQHRIYLKEKNTTKNGLPI